MSAHSRVTFSKISCIPAHISNWYFKNDQKKCCPVQDKVNLLPPARSAKGGIVITQGPKIRSLCPTGATRNRCTDFGNSWHKGVDRENCTLGISATAIYQRLHCVSKKLAPL